MLICSHGDVIKSILADALCMHLDSFQRIVVAPASISVIRYTPHRPFVERVNDTGDLGSISPYPEPAAADAARGRRRIRCRLLRDAGVTRLVLGRRSRRGRRVNPPDH